MSQSQAMLPGVCFVYSSKVMLVTCDLHSLLGLFSRLVFEQTVSGDWCRFVVKNKLFLRDPKGIEDFL